MHAIGYQYPRHDTPQALTNVWITLTYTEWSTSPVCSHSELHQGVAIQQLLKISATARVMTSKGPG